MNISFHTFSLASLTRFKLIRNTILFSFWLRICFVLVKAFRGPIHPHSWRQMDTLGVSMRYWLRFTTEGGHEGLKSLLPAVLQSGDGNGILPMEFPILNLAFSPLWAFGPYCGKILVTLTFGILITWITLKLSKKGHYLSLSFLLLPTISYSADFFEKFLPDTLAMLVITWGCFDLIKNRTKGLVLITLSLLMKPTSIIGLIYLFWFKRFRKNFIRYSLLLTIPILVTVFYYTKGLQFISSHTVNTPNIFYVGARNPIESLKGLLNFPEYFEDQILNRFFMMWGTQLFLFLIIFKRRLLNFKIILWAVLGMFSVFLTICALDGPHLVQHNYYLLSGAPFYCAVFYLVLRNTKKWAAIIGCVFIAGHAIELCAQNLDFKHYRDYHQAMNEAQTLKTRNPDFPWNQGHVFRSNEEPYPSTGLYFGERQGSKTSAYGFYYHLETDQTPPGCKL